MAANRVKVEIKDSVASITFQGRDKLNLLDRELAEELMRSFDQWEMRHEVRAFVLKGEGDRAFSAGVDLRQMKSMSPLEAEAFIRTLHALMRHIMRLRQPVIASIRGPCLGGALELAMSCDLRIASRDSSFGLPEVRVGIPSVIQASLLQRLIGLGKARELILTGDVIDAEEALRLGLVNKVVPADMLQEESLEMAGRFARLNPYTIGVQKDILDKWLNLGEEEAAEYSIKAFALCFSTSHPREGMEAFLEKR